MARCLVRIYKRYISPSTLKSYECVVNAHLRSELGQYSLAEITSPLLREFLNKKKDSGLSARSVEYMHTLLKTSLRLAVDDDLLIKNPMDKIKKPKKEPTKKIVAYGAGDRNRTCTPKALTY